MDISADSEINGYLSGSENLSTINAAASNIISKPDNTENQENQEKNQDFHNLSDISVSSADTYTPRTLQNMKYMMPIEITDWEPCLIGDKLVISGIVAGSVQTDRVCKQRLSSLIFKDDDGITCCILGPMKSENEVPEIIRNQFKYICKVEKNGEKIFKDGIPENWSKLCLIWKCYTETVNKNSFEWPALFKSFSVEPLNQNGRHTAGKIINNGPKTKIKKKFEKYKNLLEREILRDTIIADSESDADVELQKKWKKRKVNNGFCHANNTNLETEQTSLNKRTSCYINNQIPSAVDITSKNTVCCQTDLSLKDFAENEIDSEQNDRNQSTNVTVLSPMKAMCKSKLNLKSENFTLNNQLNKRTKDESNKKILEMKTILKDLTNKDGSFESNDDTSSLEFYENIVANSTVICARQDACKKIHYICSKTLERFANRAQSNVDDVLENLDVIDIDLFSQSVLKSRDESSTKSSTNSTGSGKNVTDVTENMSENVKELKTKKKRLRTEVPLKMSLRKRKKLNYKELVFNRITLPENTIIDSKLRNTTLPHSIKKPKKQSKTDEKLYKKCFVILLRENLEQKKTNTISTSNFTVTNNINVEKENTPAVDPVQTEHTFKTPLTKIVKKHTLNKTSIPNYMPRIPKNRKKLSLPANAMEMWKIIKSRTKFEKPPSPISFLTDVSSDSSDKKRRKLFSPDNWMQSDGCLKNLSQNQYPNSDGRFSIRFDEGIDSEFSDYSNTLTSC